MDSSFTVLLPRMIAEYNVQENAWMCKQVMLLDWVDSVMKPWAIRPLLIIDSYQCHTLASVGKIPVPTCEELVQWVINYKDRLNDITVWNAWKN